MNGREKEGGQEWGSVTDQCPRYRAIGCWKEDLCDRMERLDLRGSYGRSGN